jgi:hypothetical protein
MNFRSLLDYLLDESADLAVRISKFLCLQKSEIVNCLNSTELAERGKNATIYINKYSSQKQND